MTTPYDDLPIEVRRENWGWFGEAWPSGVCYDEDGLLIAEMRKPFPSGEACLLCEEEFTPGDSGQATPFLSADGGVVRHVHKECQFMNVTGPLAHHERRRRFPVPEPYALLVELCIRPGQTAHQLADARGHRVTCRGRRLTYDSCVRTALEAMLAAGTVRYEDTPGGRGRAGFHRLWYAAVRP